MLLNKNNVGDYLLQLKLAECQQQKHLKVEPIAAKNFNLLVTLPDSRKLLIKQERHDREGKTAGEFQQEWRIQELWRQFPELSQLTALLPKVLHFDPESSIIVFQYLDEYRDLSDFYTKENYFSREIAGSIGMAVASVHRATFDRQVYADFLSKKTEQLAPDQVLSLIQGLERIPPEIFGLVPAEGLKFFALYQRYDSLGQAIAQVGTAFTPACLTHNDLKLNNILLHNDWKQTRGSMVRLIDWERATWGDPAFDLGTLIASYLQIWLSSLVISNSLSIEESLRLATTPLEQLQPSIAALTQAYFNTFPEILQHRPDFLRQIVQFAGLALIQQIQAIIQYQKSFGNTGICMLQVAKTLLCRPEQAIPTVFGTSAAELNRLSCSAT